MKLLNFIKDSKALPILANLTQENREICDNSKKFSFWLEQNYLGLKRSVISPLWFERLSNLAKKIINDI